MGSRLLNAVVGAATTVVLAPLVPFSPVVGGALAGYFESDEADEAADSGERAGDGPSGDGPSGDGLRVGALSGAIAFVPLVLLFALFGALLLGFFTGTLMGGMPMPGGPGGPGMVGGLGAIALVFAALVGALYVVGLSAVGGWVGVYLRTEL